MKTMSWQRKALLIALLVLVGVLGLCLAAGATPAQTSGEENAFIKIAFDQDLPGFKAMQQMGNVALSVFLLILLTIELYRLIVSGSADFFTPLFKVGSALLLINALVPLQSGISESLAGLSKMVLQKDVMAIASDAFSAAFSGVTDIGIWDVTKVIFSPVSWLFLLIFLAMCAIIIIKLVVIDILCPVMLALVIATGTISIPIGVLPGTGTFKGWVLNVLEIASWPIIFSLISMVLFASFQSNLKDMNANTMTELQKIYETTQASLKETEGAVAEGNAPALAAREQMENWMDQYWMKFIKFLALACAYGLICLSTPMIARAVIRGESVGVMAAAVGGLATAGVAKLGGGALGRFASAARDKQATYGQTQENLLQAKAIGDAVQAGNTTLARDIAKNLAEKLDKRN